MDPLSSGRVNGGQRIKERVVSDIEKRLRREVSFTYVRVSFKVVKGHTGSPESDVPDKGLRSPVPPSSGFVRGNSLDTQDRYTGASLA